MALPALACNLDHNLLTAALPLLEEGTVGALEWSYDAVDSVPRLPDWFAQLLSTYSTAGRLVGHGIFYSVCSGRWTAEQQTYLQRLQEITRRFPFDHVTEHFGYMTGRDFHRGAPIAPPLNAASLRVGRDRLLRLREAAGCPVGLENLALAYRRDDVFRQSEFLDRLLEPMDGLLILDLHNLYCQVHNFSLDPPELLDAYPLHRVREIHLSGGSWEGHPAAPAGRVRRDTHDDRVPEEVFDLLRTVVPRCPKLKYIVLEQLGTALHSKQQVAAFQDDYRKLMKVGEEQGFISEDFPPLQQATGASPVGPPLVEPHLAAQQAELSDLLESSESIDELGHRLRASTLSGSDWAVEDWSPHMLETVWKIARKWR